MLSNYSKTLSDKQACLDSAVERLARVEKLRKARQDAIGHFKATSDNASAAASQAAGEVEALRLYVEQVGTLARVVDALPKEQTRLLARRGVASLVKLDYELDVAREDAEALAKEAHVARVSYEKIQAELTMYGNRVRELAEEVRLARVARDAAKTMAESMQQLADGTLYPSARLVTLTKQAGRAGSKNLPHYRVSFTCEATMPAGYLQDLPASCCVVDRAELLKVAKQVCTTGMLGCAPAVKGSQNARAAVYDALAATYSDQRKDYLQAVAAWLRAGCPSKHDDYHVVWLTGDGLKRGYAALLFQNQLEDATKQARGAWSMIVRVYPTLFQEKKTQKKRKAENDHEAKRRA